MNEEELKIVCSKIRHCLDQWSTDGTLRTIAGREMNNFPNGCCGIVTECLAVILYKMTGTKPNMVTGECPSGHPNNGKLAANSHAWIEINGINIDLTGDQFNDGDIFIPPVWVSSSPHTLSNKMKITTKPAYLIGITKEASGFDATQLRLISELWNELKL
ncbi:hypothetical protein [Enterobacter ludwigii]|uniref:hypothetical protein n=1 Tax=Enterobacter ludwigii TaxID=299767 RepID=UPI0032AF8199